MIMEVTEFEKKYTFELSQITQLCGTNIGKKTFICESIRKYFGGYRYSETNNKWRDNVWIDGTQVGRKYYSLLSVRNIQDLSSFLKLTKQSLLQEYLKELMQDFDWQKQLSDIDYTMEKMFGTINNKLADLGEIELFYSQSDIWDMVQVSSVYGHNQENLEDKSPSELMNIFLNLVEQLMVKKPRKVLLLLENIDHMLSRDEYFDVINKMRKITNAYDVWFVVTTSLPGFVSVTKELLSGITVFGDVDFQFPEIQHLMRFVEENYPAFRNWEEKEVEIIIRNIIQGIGQNKSLYQVQEAVVLKLVNESMGIKQNVDMDNKTLEISFLKE